MVDAGIYRRGEDPTTVEIREQLHFALDAIASEIARQADEISKGNPVDAGKELDAIVERLKETSPRAGIEERLHTAFEATNPDEAPDQKWVSELPEPVKQAVDHAAISDAVRTWQDCAVEVWKIAPMNIAEADQLAAADGLNNADNGFADKTRLAMESDRIGALDKDVQSIGYYVIQQMAGEMRKRQEQLGQRLSAPEARDLLTGTGRGRYELAKLVQDLGMFEQSLKTSYYQAGERVKKDGKPGYYWRDFYSQVGSPGGTYYYEKTALNLNNALGLEPNLFNLLNNWSTQWDSEPDKRYELTWQLIATLRRHKQIGGAVLREAGQEAARTFWMTSFDALTDAITEKVNKDVAPGTA
jgi:hypothetical protein